MDAIKQSLLNKQIDKALSNSISLTDKYNITLTYYNETVSKTEKKSTLGSNIIRFLKQEIAKIDTPANKGHSILLSNKSFPNKSFYLQCIVPNIDLLPILNELTKLNRTKVNYKTHILKEKYLAFYNQYITIYDVKDNLG